MEREYFWLDGVRCDTVGIHLQGPVTFSAPRPKMESVPVPGRNGELHYYDGAYSNVTGTARCFALEKQYVDRALSSVEKYTLLNPGYHRLETTEEPDYFRMAAVTSGAETEIRMRHLAPFNLEFNCMPQKFFRSGEIEINIQNGDEIYNNGFPASPLITVTGSGDGTLFLADRKITFRTNFIGPVIYDAETENAYYDKDNKNDEIQAQKIIIPNGNCKISWTGGIESVTIIPRWWTL